MKQLPLAGSVARCSRAQGGSEPDSPSEVNNNQKINKINNNFNTGKSMKKILLFLMSLLLFAPNISALDEEVYLGFWIPEGTSNNTMTLISEAGVYSKREDEPTPVRTNYTVKLTCGLKQNAKADEYKDISFPYVYNDSKGAQIGQTTYGAISKFMVMSNNGSVGFNVEFNPVLRPVSEGGSNQASSGYALRYELPKTGTSNNNYGTYNGLCLINSSNYPKITISSTSEWRPIKKIKFGQTRSGADNSPNTKPYSLSSFTGTENMNEYFVRIVGSEPNTVEYPGVSEDGTWEFDATDNCWTYVLTVPKTSVEFSVSRNKQYLSSALYLNKLGIVWDAPIDAPTINMSAAPTDGTLTETGVNTYSYNSVAYTHILAHETLMNRERPSKE